jgi:hypothetical protein
LRAFGARLNRCLDLGHAAIDEQLNSGDVAAVGRGEEHDGVGTSSGVPIRPIGTAATRPTLNSSICSRVSPALLKIGVSIGPGLMTLTRILRCLRSVVQHRANDRTAALLAQ